MVKECSGRWYVQNGRFAQQIGFCVVFVLALMDFPCGAQDRLLTSSPSDAREILGPTNNAAAMDGFSGTRWPRCGVQGASESLLDQPKAQAVPGLSMEARLKASGTGDATLRRREIEVMLLYTSQAKAGAGSSDKLASLIQLGMIEVNSVFENSRTGVTLRLVQVSEIDYAESGNVSVDLARLRARDDGVMDEIHAWRDAAQADLVCLVVENAGGYEGMATFPNGTDPGFSVIQRRYLTGYGLLAHEFGHNFGCDHDWGNASKERQFSYSYGYRFEVEGEIYRTIMAYPPGSLIPYFSNPEVLYRGVPTGQPEGVLLPLQATDNARTIREMATTIDWYRGTRFAISSPPEGTVLEEGKAVEIVASVSTMDGEVQEVEFFDQGSFLTSVSAPPYRYLWILPAAGKHLLSARLRIEGAPAPISASVLVGVKPANDDFSHRIVLAGSNVLATTSLSAATAETGEPELFGLSGYTGWWSWRALTTVASSSEGDLVFPAERGRRYMFAVDLLDPRVSLVASTPVQARYAVLQQASASGVVRNPNGGLDVLISGEAGQTLLLQASPNLMDWRTVRATTLQLPEVRFHDVLFGADAKKFFRVIPIAIR